MSVLVFNRWGVEGILVKDVGFQRYITLEPRFVPKTGARYAGKMFHKSKVFIVDRLVNNVMIPGHKAKKHFRSSGHATGKSALSYRIVMDAFKIIEQKTKQNPVAVFVLINPAIC